MRDRILNSVAVAVASDAPRFSGGRSAAAAAVPTHGTAAPRPAIDAPASPRTGSWKVLNKQGGRVELVPKEEDLESDQDLWKNMYERWCKAFDQKREPDEMARRFNKNRVLEIHSMNNANPSCKVGLTKFTDGKIAELRANRDRPQHTLAKKFSTPVSFIQRGDDKFLKEVFADFDVVNGKLFVYFPLENGKRHDKKEISTEYEVTRGCLFVADLPEAPELLIPTPEWIMRRHPPYFY